mgnify:CR=1 FL=1
MGFSSSIYYVEKSDKKMTYFDVIDSLYKNENDNRDITLINNLNTLSFKGNVLYRFIDHLNDFVLKRLNNMEERLTKSILNYNQVDEFNLDILNFNKEINYLFQFSNIKMIPDDEKNKIKKLINENVSIIIDNLMFYAKKDPNNEILIKIISESLKVGE